MTRFGLRSAAYSTLIGRIVPGSNGLDLQSTSPETTLFETDQAVVVIHGQVYDQSPQDICAYVADRMSKIETVAAEMSCEAVLVVFDKTLRRLSLVRDRFGSRGLYWRILNGGLSFACDCAPLVAEHRPALCPEPVLDLLSGRYLAPHSATGFHEVFQVPPAHILHFDQHGTHQDRYWSSHHVPTARVRDLPAHLRKGQDLLRAAVVRRLPQTNAAIEVSGGLDSSAIACLGVQETHRTNRAKPHLRSWQDRSEAVDTHDSRMLHLIEDHTSASIYDASMSVADLLQVSEIDPILVPQASTLPFSLAGWRGSQQAGGSVLLTGWGGDQAISHKGYRLRRRLSPDWALQLRRRAPQAPAWVKAPAAQMLLARPSHGYLQTGNVRRAQHIALTLPALSQRMTSEIWIAAHFGASVRYPLLDRDLTEFALGTPAWVYQTGGMPRGLFRSMLDGIVPDDLRLRPDKSDPLRFQQSDKIFCAAAGVLIDRLATQKLSPDRLAFVDRDVLCRALERIAAKAPRAGRGRAFAAAQFLLTG